MNFADLKHALASARDKVLNETFPDGYTCEICGIEVFGKRLCRSCMNGVEFIAVSCPVCGRKTQTESLCLECKAKAPKFDKAVSVFVYRDGAALLVKKFKNGHAYLKEYFAELLSERCEKFKGAEAVCYVPMTEKAKKKRGYNQAELLAKALAERLDLPVLDGAVIKVKDTEEQKTLSHSEREKNLLGCFKADSKLVRGKKLILIDDVMTTAATADAVAAALRKRGAKNIYFATVASVEYKREL